MSEAGPGAPSVKAQCLPFTEIPHTSRLFADFLYSFPKVSQFYPRPPQYTNWISEQASKISYDPARRQQIAAVMLRQNRAWSASEKTLANLAKFESGALAAVTGQQVGLFGGPLFTIFKVLSAVKLAEEASAKGIPCVPIFWMATEDHDLAEINHAWMLGMQGELRSIATPTKGIEGAPVGGIQFGDEILPVVEQVAALLGESEATAWLRDAYRPGETFGGAFAKFYSRVFGELGVILLDPSDPELHGIARPIYAGAIQHAKELNDGLLQRGKELTAGGYHEQVKVTPSSTALFEVRNGVRTAIHHVRSASGSEAEETFDVGGARISQATLLDQIVTRPEDFNPNALLRPVVQDFLLPTLAYVGGPAEVAYFAQSAVIYEKLLGRVTPILPRFSATIVDAKLAGLMTRYGLQLSDLFPGPQAVKQMIGNRTLPPEIHAEFDAAQQAFEDSLARVRGSLERLDSTLIDAADRAGRKIRYQLTRLRERAARAELRRSEILSRHAALLSNSLYPEKVQQERELSAAVFLARHGADFPIRVMENVNPDCVDHQILFWE